VHVTPQSTHSSDSCTVEHTTTTHNEVVRWQHEIMITPPSLNFRNMHALSHSQPEARACKQQCSFSSSLHTTNGHYGVEHSHSISSSIINSLG